MRDSEDFETFLALRKMVAEDPELSLCLVRKTAEGETRAVPLDLGPVEEEDEDE